MSVNWVLIYAFNFIVYYVKLTLMSFWILISFRSKWKFISQQQQLEIYQGSAFYNKKLKCLANYFIDNTHNLCKVHGQNTIVLVVCLQIFQFSPVNGMHIHRVKPVYLLSENLFVNCFYFFVVCRRSGASPA